MSANAAAEGAAKPKSNLIKIVLIVVAVLVLAGGAAGGTWFFMKGGSHAKGKDTHAEAAAGDEEDDEAPSSAKKPAPIYMALDNMVVNLADPGGDRFAQIGVTLELSDEKLGDQIKQRLPAVRSSILMLVSQRTAEELLRRDGKDKLAQDIVMEVSRVAGLRTPRPIRTDGEGDRRPLTQRYTGPIRAVLFASFIVQ
ncbi:MAG: flagellar basal body-associated protein FliL [Gammaproteobacteria bacterium]|uniref:flagellar basal body-associated FliL family protein n=1 Tax=unclassified Pseudacidovorax TaxID=2620592 RepID=UPI001B7879D2|nr:flagellar basal body-associated FliL family protein [Pseudacidovorax sp.]MBP6894811.1 flagellar basal body-associated FliL family protein [Pseudacidovorax sp.]